MERQTSLFLISVALLVCSATVFAQSVFVANFEEYKEGDDYGYARGKVYYKYDGTCAAVATGKPECVGKTDRSGSRLSFQYEIGVELINNLYQYGEGAMYSMCSSSCSGILLTHKADPWFFDNRYYTKSNVKVGDLYWYNRTLFGTSTTVSMDADLVSPQVTAILMNGKTTFETGLIIKKIIFDDHRVVEFDTSSIKFETGHEDKFTVNPNLNCPKATCPIYADLVFVLDNSGSVDKNEWSQTVNFVKKVIDTFSFGEDAANAAVIQFNAPYTYGCSTRSVTYPCPTSSNPGKTCSCSGKYYKDCSFSNVAFPGKDTATLIAGRNVLGTNDTISVSADPFSIKNNLTGKPSCYGNTCQGFGLELAIRVLQNSPRRRYGNRPQPIVIAVTDGVDFCPNRTFNAAEKLRSDFGALVIEVGVGMSTGCGGYDINFLKRLSSQIGSEDNRAYYNVTNYNAIKELSDKLFKPICVGMDGACGPDCYGFCGCGKCMCPTCRESHSSCYNVTCLADATSSTGCRREDHPCPKDDKCNTYECQGNIYDESKRCLHHDKKDICRKLYDDNANYKCREINCDNIKGCYVDYNDNWCNEKFKEGNECYDYACSKTDNLADLSLGDGKTGCYLRHNYTKELEDAMKQDSRINCFAAKCYPDIGAKPVDLCPSRLVGDENFPPACYNSACVLDAGEYQCINTAKEHDRDTACAVQVCDATLGWIYSKRPESEKNCTREFLDNRTFLPSEAVCMLVDCPAEGEVCTFVNRTETEGCDAYCYPEKLAECDSAAQSFNTGAIEECTPFTCEKIYNTGIGDWEGICQQGVTVSCLENTELINEIEELNKDNKTTKCYYVQCMNGRCSKNFTYKPTDNNDKCQRYDCSFVSTGIYEWKLVPSEEALNCHDNACFERHCTPDEGCVNKRDICEKLSNFCFNLTCIDLIECRNESLLNRTECVKEVCDNGKPRPVYDVEASCVLVNTYKCLSATCEYEGNIIDENGHDRVGPSKCVYDDIPEPQDDICMQYTCDNNTGEWNATEKCVDGDLCTEDICNVFGQCRNPEITCAELSMEAYPCYYRQCIPDPANNAYMCRRRHIKGAMIDLCGNCIMEKEERGPVVLSDSMLMDSKYVRPESSSSSSSISLISCTMAGPRPLLTEGLAAASIALIIIGAVVIGAGIAASSVLGTRELIKRAKGANNQSAHTNPLFQENEAEMSNPAFIEEKDA